MAGHLGPWFRGTQVTVPSYLSLPRKIRETLMTEALYRWIVRSSFDGVLPKFVAAVRDPVIAGHEFYLSNQNPDACLTLFAPINERDAIGKAVEGHLTGHSITEAHCTTSDDILTLPWFRTRLHQVTEVALDLRTTSATARATLGTVPDPFNPSVGLYCGNVAAAYRAALEPLLTASPAFQRLVKDPDDFWKDFARWPGPRALSPAGHWLWNIVG